MGSKVSEPATKVKRGEPLAFKNASFEKKVTNRLRVKAKLCDSLNMDRKRFLDLLEKYLRDDATPQEKSLIDAWYERMGRSHVDGMEGENEDALEKRYLSNLDLRIKKQAGKYRMVVWQSLRIAATIIFIIVSSFSIRSGSDRLEVNRVVASADAISPSWEKVINTGIDAREVRLPDGSLVVLEPESEVRFMTAFNGMERSVWLEGEAFFDVCPDKTKPFMVYARELTTKVLGTSFSVRSRKNDKDAAVSVRTGKVFVVTSSAKGPDAGEREVVLTPNQRIIYDKVQDKIARSIVEKPAMVLPAEEVRKMRFEGAPVSAIFNAIEKVYGVDLVFDSTIVQQCRLTSVISDGELFNRLEIICKAIGARYELEENRIVIHGTPCNSERNSAPD